MKIKKLWQRMLILGISIFVAYLFIKQADRVVFINEVKLVSLPVPDFYDGNQVIAILHQGEQATVIEDYHTKDWHVVKIRTANGLEGFVLGDRDYKKVE